MSRTAIDPELLLAHAPFLRSLARALRDDVTDADDLAQETARRALTRAPRESAAAALRSWLAHIMRSVRREANRSAQRRSLRERTIATPEADATQDPARIVERLELVERLARAVAELPEHPRELLVECYLDGRSPPIMARSRGVPLATVHTQLRRARELLRTRLRPGDDESSSPAWLAALSLLANGDSASLPPILSLRVAAALLVGLAAGIGGWWWHTADESLVLANGNRVASSEQFVTAAFPAVVEPSPSRADAFDALDGSIADDRPLVAAQVVLAESGEPAVGATVSFKEIGATPLEREAFTARLYSRFPGWWFEDDDQRQRDVEAFLENSAGPFLEVGATDLEGGVVLPPFEDAIVRIVLGERRLIRRLSITEPQPVRLAIELPYALTIRVVDRQGAPVPRISVAIEAEGSRGRQILWRSHTGLDGFVAVPPRHFERFRQEAASSLWSVTLGVAADDAPRVAIDPAALPTTPVELMLAASGTVRVEVRDADDRRISSPALVGLARQDPERGVVETDVGMAWRLATDGIAEFAGVPLGLQLVVRPVDRRHSGAPVEFSGPTRDGETTEFVAKLGPPSPAVRGRIVQADGSPIRNWRFRSRWSVASAPHLDHFVTDGDGRFQLSLLRYDFETDEPQGIPVDRGWMTLLPFEAALLDPALREAAIVVPLESWLLEPGEHDLGDLRCTDSHVVAAGRVVDRDGNPVGGVEVAVQTTTERGWRRVSGLESRSSAEGDFHVVGRTALAPLQCTVVSPGWRSAGPIDFAAGQRDLLLVVEPTAILRGRLLLDPGLPVDQLVVRPSESLQPLADVRELMKRGTPPVTLTVDGNWKIALLGAGRGTLEVGLGNGIVGHFEIEPLTAIEGVTSDTAGSADPRLLEIDLRGRLRVITLDVRDRDGAPVPAARVEARAVHGDGKLGPRRRLITDMRGTATLLAGAARYALRLTKDGYAALELDDVGSDCRIELERQP